MSDFGVESEQCEYYIPQHFADKWARYLETTSRFLQEVVDNNNEGGVE